MRLADAREQVGAVGIVAQRGAGLETAVEEQCRAGQRIRTGLRRQGEFGLYPPFAPAQAAQAAERRAEFDPAGLMLCIQRVHV